MFFPSLFIETAPQPSHRLTDKRVSYGLQYSRSPTVYSREYQAELIDIDSYCPKLEELAGLLLYILEPGLGLLSFLHWDLKLHLARVPAKLC